MLKSIIDFVKKNFAVIAVLFIAAIYLEKSGLFESWASSPGTLLQLSASSGYYPFWRRGYGYRYPYYRMMGQHGAYNNSYNDHAHYPRPNHYYNYY